MSLVLFAFSSFFKPVDELNIFTYTDTGLTDLSLNKSHSFMFKTVVVFAVNHT